jgi:hypothetical protein
VQKVLVPITGNCVQVTLTGNLKYERSTAAKPGDRHFRHLLITEPAMEWLFYASCTKGADLVALRHIDAAQTFTTTDGRALARNAEKWAGLHRGVSQYNTGIPTRADGVTGRGKICVSVLPSLIARNGALEFMAPLHKATVCGH